MRRGDAKALTFIVTLPLAILLMFLGILSENAGPILLVFFAILSLVPAMAANWRSLAIRSGLTLGLLSLLLAWNLLVSRPDEATIFLLVLAVPPFLGTVARGMSLLAEKMGHGRPASLWIEVLVFLPVLVYLGVAMWA